MPLHPDAIAFMDARNAMGAIPTETLAPDAARAQLIRHAKLGGPGEPVARVENRDIPGPERPLAIRIYYPSQEKDLPILFYIHGGGWVQGNLDTADNLCRIFCNLSQFIVVSTDYRHAPESKFPAAPQDAFAALQWVAAHAAELGGDPNKLAISGTSAGANLAAAVTLMARDGGAPKIDYQVLIVPVTDAGRETDSFKEHADGYVLTRAVMDWCWDHYLADPSDGDNPLASPLRASDLSGLPPAFLATAEYDPLRDEGKAYAERLAQAGVPVEYHCYQGMIHAFIGRKAYEDAMNALKANVNS